MLFGTRPDLLAERQLIKRTAEFRVNPQTVDGGSDSDLSDGNAVEGGKSFRLKSATRFAAIISLDLFAICAGLIATLLAGRLFFADYALAPLAFKPAFLLIFGAVSTTVLISTGLYSRSWRFLSVADMIFLTVVTTAALAASWAITALFFAEVTAARNLMVITGIAHTGLCLTLLAAMRVCRRGLRIWRQRKKRHSIKNSKPVIILGDLDWASHIITLVRKDQQSGIRISGIITPDHGHMVGRVSGIPILGPVEMLPVIVQLMQQSGVKLHAVIIPDDTSSLGPDLYRKLTALGRDSNIEIRRFRDPLSQITGPVSRINGAAQLETISTTDLLGRPELDLERGLIRQTIANRKILVTGAGGSIGSELVRQIAAFNPSEIILLENCEFNLFNIDMEIREKFPKLIIRPELCCVRERSAVRRIFRKHRPNMVFHAAALKHVPLVELNPCAGAHTNILGTRNIADAMCEFGGEAMILVSTDKAVNPVGTMGGTKRLSELYCQALDKVGEGDEHAPRLITVRFGNVIGSSGSLIPLFQKQLSDGRDLTVTHPDMERFFMTIQEAVQLVLHSSAQSLERDGDRGHLFVLDMGQPVKIVDIAHRMIQMAGMDGQVTIKFIGLRPGEKLYEELFDNSEEQFDVGMKGVFGARTKSLPLSILSRAFDEMEKLIENGDEEAVRNIIRRLIALAQDESQSFMFAQGVRLPGGYDNNVALLDIGRMDDGSGHISTGSIQ